MLSAVLATSVIGLILILSELLWRNTHLKGEFARKFVHIVAGAYIAFLPFFINYNWIVVLGIAFIAVNLVNRYTPLFHAIHAITRKSWGDLFLGLGIVILGLIKPNEWIFGAAILQVALADGLAAAVGSRFAKKPYQVFDHKKSIIGTLTFLVVSAFIVFAMLQFSGIHVFNKLVSLLILTVSMTVLENVSGYGIDNLSLPLGLFVLVKLLSL